MGRDELHGDVVKNARQRQGRSIRKTGNGGKLVNLLALQFMEFFSTNFA